MQIWNHYFAGVADIWLLLLVNLCLLVFVTVRLWRLCTSRKGAAERYGRMARDESGATYMLPLVLVMPFYVLLITMIVECTLMLTQKIGSVGAAYSAARAAAVWLPYESAIPKDAPDYTPLPNRQAMVRLAAARAMWPYASGSKSHAASEPLDAFIEATAEQQIEVFQAYSGDSQFDKAYLKRKFAYAINASTVEIVYLDPVKMSPTDNPVFNAKIQLTLHYEAPIHTYGFGRLFGEKSQFGNYYVRPVVTTVVIENEGVKVARNESVSKNPKASKSLGIKYYDRTASGIASPTVQASVGPRTDSGVGTEPATGVTNMPGNQTSNGIYSTAAERHSAEEALAALEQRYQHATGAERERLAEQITDYRIALELANTTGRDSSTNEPIESPVHETEYRVYITEDRLAIWFYGQSRGRTFIENSETGEVHVYRHLGEGGSAGAGVGVAYAELESAFSSSDFDPRTSLSSLLSSAALELQAVVGIGGVSQINIDRQRTDGFLAGAMIGAGLGVGATRYEYVGTFPNFASAGYSAIWFKPRPVTGVSSSNQ